MQKNSYVIVPVSLTFWQEVVGVEFVGIRVDGFQAMEFVRGHNDRGTRWNDVIPRDELQIFLHMTSDDRYWWVHSESFHHAAFEVFHLQSVLEGAGAIRVAENLIEFSDHLVLLGGLR